MSKQEEQIEEFVENLVAVHTNTVSKWLRNNRTIGEAVAEANKEATAKINKLLIEAQLDILIWATGGIKEFTDEGREAIQNKIATLTLQANLKEVDKQ